MCKSSRYKSSNFSLTFTQKENQLKIKMRVFSSHVTTKDLPHTFSFLKSVVPSVLLTECFNDKNLPFASEVKATELGHLFEHILIDQLTAAKVKLGYKHAIFNGKTHWNWNRDPHGVFHILIDLRKDEEYLLAYVLNSTIVCIENLLNDFSPNYLYTTKQPAQNKFYGQLN